jgi:hypothetical protein
MKGSFGGGSSRQSSKRKPRRRGDLPGFSLSRQNFRFKFPHDFRHLAISSDLPGKLPLTFGFFAYILY